MSDSSSENLERLIIRKYPNRRYYDTTHSRHLTLEEIYGLIRAGHDVQVTDSKTGEDITGKVLAQIIIELDPLKLSVFPLPLLHRLLRSNEHSVTEFIRRYFSQMASVFINSQRDLENYFQGIMGMHGQTPTWADWARAAWGPLGVPPIPPPAGASSASSTAATNRNGDAPPAEPPAQNAAPGGMREELNLLREEIASLRAQLPTRAKKRSKHPKSSGEARSTGRRASHR